jgi:hypothetical protein
MSLIKKSVGLIIPYDECGRLVNFKIPKAAMYYDMACTKLRDQDKVDDTQDELIELHYSISES